MKKIIALVLALALCLCMFAGCASKDAAADNKTEDTKTENKTEEKTEEKTEDKTEDSDVDYSSVKVGFIFLHDENSTYDLNFMNAAKTACENLGIPESNYMFKTNVPEGQECYEAAADLADAGCSIVFADSFGHEDFMIQAAKDFPDVEFCHATGTQAHTAGVENFHDAFATIFQGRYLGGVAAGMKLNEMIENGEITEDQAKVGYIGAFTYAEVISGYTSFFLGVRSVCPAATMDVTFTGSWYDEAAEKEGANMLINNGCVLISLHADSMGAPTACQTAGVPFVFYNGTCADACPDTFIVSSRINWAPYYEFAIKAAVNGETIPADWTGDISTESVLMSEVNEKAAAAGTAEKLEEVKKAIMDGTVKVFDTTTFTVNGETLTSYEADVDTDPEYAKDTEVISGNEFLESYYRSAPYFDIQIDGINLLDTAF